jgi:TonB family protein
MSDSWRDSEGQVVDGQFQLVKHLGGSDHSVVFLTQRGKDKSEKAAIKFIQADAANADAQLARWKQTAQISHPNLIKLFESGRCQLAGLDLLYVVMEYAQENLAEFLPQRALSAAETRDMLEPFVDTLSHLHGKSFAHGRIKPGNILAIDDQLKLSSDSVCRDGELQIGAGKPDSYIAPEAVNGKTSPAADVWSLGVTLVASLTQRTPDETTSGDPQISDAIPQPFLDIARSSLRRDIQARWTVAEISNRLNPVAVPAPVAAPVSAAEPAAVSARASSAATAAVAVAEPPKPASAKSAVGGSAATSTAIASAAPAIPAAVPASAQAKAVPLAKAAKPVDPLSVPLSTIAPKFDAGSSSNRSWYIAIVLIVAFTAGAVFAIPRLRELSSAPDSSSTPATTPSPSNAQPVAAPPAAVPAPVESKPETAPPSKSAQPAPSHGGIDGRPQVASAEPSAQNATPESTPASAREYIKKNADAAAPTPKKPVELHAESIAPLPATSHAAPLALPAGPVTIGSPLNQVMPEVSAKSRSTIHGTVRVVVKIHVDASGAVASATPASSPSKFFGDAAVQAARQWDFTPAKVSGQAVPSEWLVRFDFTPSDTKVLPSETKP